MGKPVYLNYAATSINKPKKMLDTVCQYLQEETGLSYNRSLASDVGTDIIYQGREEVARFFNVKDSSHVVFTENITMSLNMVLNGLLKKGDHVVTSAVEHNAVMRPLTLLKEKLGIEITLLPSTKEGVVCLKDVEKELRPNTKLLVLTGASNVLGTILPIKEMFKFAREKGVITVLDSAQTAGFLPIDMEVDAIDVLTFTGHKSLQALSGIGGFALTKEVAGKMKPWLVGGTGSLSHLLKQPENLPEKFESGTLNAVGILSLLESIRWSNEVGINNIANHQLELTEKFLIGLEGLPVQVLGTKDIKQTVPVVSLVCEKYSASELSYQLFEEYNILTRCGLHCAPSAHQVAGTFPDGAVRFSFGYATTAKEIEFTLNALGELLDGWWEI